MKYYRVRVMAGHNKNLSTIEYLTFYFRAKDLISATKMARAMPGVKHSRTNCVESAKEITYKEYKAKRTMSAYKRREV